MLTKYFPIWLHVIVATGMIGWAAGLHKVGTNIPLTYAITGFAVGTGITAFFRVLDS